MQGYDDKKLNLFISDTLAEENIYDLMYVTKQEGKVWQHPSVPPKNEAVYNLKYAKILADEGHQIHLLSYMNGRKNPDFLLDGIVSDFKEPEKVINKNFFDNRVSELSKSNIHIGVFIIPKNKYDFIGIKDGLYNSLNNDTKNRAVKEIWLIIDNKAPIKILRSEVKDGSYVKKLL